MFKISVIIPTFNRSHTLSRALDSVMKQSYPIHEIIVIDDGSTDNTLALIQAGFPSITVIEQANKGVSNARNRGIKQATGDWIALLDSDDEWLPDKLLHQTDRLSAAPEYKVCHTEEIWVRNSTRVNQMNKHQKSGGHIFQQCLPLCAMSPSSILIHRYLFDELGPFDETLPACEDYEMWLRITASNPVLFIDQPQIIKHGGHEDQLSRKYWGMDRFRIYALDKTLKNITLSMTDRQAAISMLLEKARIYQQGALKRGKQAEAEHYHSLIDHYSAIQDN